MHALNPELIGHEIETADIPGLALEIDAIESSLPQLSEQQDQFLKQKTEA